MLLPIVKICGAVRGQQKAAFLFSASVRPASAMNLYGLLGRKHRIVYPRFDPTRRSAGDRSKLVVLGGTNLPLARQLLTQGRYGAGYRSIDPVWYSGELKAIPPGRTMSEGRRKHVR